MLTEALAPVRDNPARGAVLLDIDGVLAPIVRHAEDAHVPEHTRAPLIAVARRYGLVACVSGRRAATARRIVSLGSITYVGNHGAEILRGGATDIELDPEVARWAPKVREFAEQAYSRDVQRLRVRAEDKDVIRAFHWRGAPDEEAAEEAVREIAKRAEEAGLVDPLGPQGARDPPARGAQQGPRRAHACSRRPTSTRRCTSATTRTDLDAFAALRELVGEGALRTALCVGVRSDETPAELEEQADLLVDGPPGVRALSSALAA